MSKSIELNKRQGGSYSKDPTTGETKLVQQTKHQEITGFEQQAEQVGKAKVSDKAKKSVAK